MTIQEKIQAILTKFGQDSVEELKRRHIEAGQKATGNAINSFVYDVIVQGYDVAMKIKGAVYSDNLDNGTPAGHMPSIEKIKKWIDAKGVFGVLDDRKKTSLAYAIGNKIKQSGTYHYRTGRTYKGATQPISSVFEKVKMEKLISEITFAIIPVVSSEIINQYKKK